MSSDNGIFSMPRMIFFILPLTEIRVIPVSLYIFTPLISMISIEGFAVDSVGVCFNTSTFLTRHCVRRGVSAIFMINLTAEMINASCEKFEKNSTTSRLFALCLRYVITRMWKYYIMYFNNMSHCLIVELARVTFQTILKKQNVRKRDRKMGFLFRCAGNVVFGGMKKRKKNAGNDRKSTNIAMILL